MNDPLAYEEALVDQALAARRPAADSRPTPYGAWAASVPAIAEFVAAAVASGVVGNLAYDALKMARTASMRFRTAPPDPEAALESLVFHAVREQCHRYDLEAPGWDDLRVTEWSCTGDAAVALVTCARSDLTATVQVPFRSREQSAVEVRIRDVAQRPALERIATAQYVERYGEPSSRRHPTWVVVTAIIALIAIGSAVVREVLVILERLF